MRRLSGQGPVYQSRHCHIIIYHLASSCTMHTNFGLLTHWNDSNLFQAFFTNAQVGIRWNMYNIYTYVSTCPVMISVMHVWTPIYVWYSTYTYRIHTYIYICILLSISHTYIYIYTCLYITHMYIFIKHTPRPHPSHPSPPSPLSIHSPLPTKSPGGGWT